MKVYRKYQQREYERIEHPNQFPSDYFFSALAELILEDWKIVMFVIQSFRKTWIYKKGDENCYVWKQIE